MYHLEKTALSQTAFRPESPRSRRKDGVRFFLRHGEGIAAALSGIFIALAWILQSGHPDVAVAFFLMAYAAGGFAKGREGLLTLVREREIDVNLLMLVAAAGAAGIGYWMEGAILIFIFAVSGVLEKYAMERSHRDISSLMRMKPETARLYENGKERQVRIGELQVGDIIAVKPGERIPADGIVKEGISSVNQAPITGESIPVDKSPGDEVYTGTLNGNGSLLVEVTRTGESSLFAKIVRLVEEAQNETPKTQQFIRRFERIYAKAAILSTLLLIVAPPYLLGWSWHTSLYKAMVFLVVASPCALMASVMPATLSAISNGARKGILFKGGAHLEHISQIRAVAFDKTGTLTEGRLQLTDLVPLQEYSEEELLRIVASVERMSEHPIAKAIVVEAERLGLPTGHPNRLQAVTGKGVVAELDGETWKIGKPSFLDRTKADSGVQSAIERLASAGKTVIAVENSKGLAGLLAVRDTVRPQAGKTVARLKELGIHTAVLTGDRLSAAEAMASQAGIDTVFADLMPQDKVEKVTELKAKYSRVAMVGDGVNDAPALANATVGIAMGAAGSDVALETADVVLMKDDIEKIPVAIELGKRTQRIVKQNLVFSLAVIVLLIVSNFVQGISLPLGVIGHEGSTVLVVLNGLRLLK